MPDGPFTSSRIGNLLRHPLSITTMVNDAVDSLQEKVACYVTPKICEQQIADTDTDALRGEE